jgi:hypothetical protein
MTDARNVYLILFFLLALPTVFFSLRRRGRSNKPKTRAALLVLMSGLLVANAAICLSAYRYTIDRQVLIVAERGALCLYRSGKDGTNPALALAALGIAGQETVVEGEFDGPWASFADAGILLPQKMLTLDDKKWHPVVLERADGQQLLLAMEIEEAIPKSKILRVRILWPEQIGTLLDRITFFTVDRIR